MNRKVRNRQRAQHSQDCRCPHHYQHRNAPKIQIDRQQHQQHAHNGRAREVTLHRLLLVDGHGNPAAVFSLHLGMKARRHGPLHQLLHRGQRLFVTCRGQSIPTPPQHHSQVVSGSIRIRAARCCWLKLKVGTLIKRRQLLLQSTAQRLELGFRVAL